MLVPALLLSQTGCNKFTDGYDVSPNSAAVTTLPLQLAAVELEVINVNTSQLARVSNIFTQHLAGTDQQYATYASYIITEQDTGNDFNTIYQGGLVNAQAMIDKGTADGSPYYAGLGNIMKAILLGIATDTWGDVPDTEALKGLANLNPVFDKQEAILVDIQRLLSAGIAQLQTPATGNKLLPGADDLIHQGDVKAWIQNAYVLKARYANRLSRRDAAGSATQALQFLDQGYAAGLTSGASNAFAVFGEAAINANQYFSFNSVRANYLKMGARLVDLMKSLNDPRLPLYAAPTATGDFVGAPLGTTSTANISDIGPLYAGSATAPIPFITFAEAKFIEAEAALRAGNTARAQTAYTDALKAHFKQVGLASTDPYITANGDLGTDPLTTIMTQKYIANFLQLEAWNDYRRTKLPALTPNPNASTKVIPERLPIPQDERINNTNAVVVSDITVPVYWAQP